MTNSPIDASQITIFHNEACSKSRGALAILNEREVDYELIEYLVTPPSRDALEAIISKLIDPVSDLVRTTDEQFVTLGLDAHAYKSDEAIIELLLEHPQLMQRPIVVKGNSAIIARPSERIDEILK